MNKKAVTVRQIQNLDKIVIEEYGIPSVVLMENAGRCVALEIIALLKKKKNSFVCIFCGLGNNAGDGFVVARHLMGAGIKIKVFLVGKAEQLKADAMLNYRILKKLRCMVKEINTVREKAVQDAFKADIIVDAIFGVGLNREISEPFSSVINELNKNAKYIVAVDIPSGLNGTTGKIYGICVKAGTTVTFSFVKKGFLKADGPGYTGKVVVADIGMPVQCVNLWKRKNGLYEKGHK